MHAGVAELADAPDLGSGIVRCEGSSPFARKKRKDHVSGLFVFTAKARSSFCKSPAILTPTFYDTRFDRLAEPREAMS